MTDLLKPIKRRAVNSRSHDGRALVIVLKPGHIDTIEIREAGRRTGYTVPVEAVYKLGARLAADAIRKERQQKKSVKRNKEN